MACVQATSPGLWVQQKCPQMISRWKLSPSPPCGSLGGEDKSGCPLSQHRTQVYVAVRAGGNS